MSSEEEKRILGMVESGVITPEEAMKLIKALEEGPPEPPEVILEPQAASGATPGDTLAFEQIKARAGRFSRVPLWLGTGFTVLAAYWLFVLVQDSNYGFWFACAWLPLALGILLVALSTGGGNARWVYVNIEQAEEEWPRHITFGIPIPLGALGWVLRNFGHHMRGWHGMDVNEMLDLLSTATKEEPLLVNLQDEEDGDRVQVYIG